MDGKEQSVVVKDLEPMTLAYVRHVGPYVGDGAVFEKLYNRLFSWAGPRGFLNDPDLKSFCMYHDNPEITEDEKLRVSVCISVPSGTAVEGDVGLMSFEGGRFAMAKFKLSVAEFPGAWKWIYSEWLPASGYACGDHGVPFELYHGGGESDDSSDELKYPVDICLPVVPV